MDELSAALKIVLSNTFVMYQKAQIYHWNVEGPMFAQYHDFFADIYGELLPAIDIAAEQIRALDTYAPFSILDRIFASFIKASAMLVFPVPGPPKSTNEKYLSFSIILKR